VYLFYGLNGLPIYVGKSVNLRDRVRSHFSGDHRSGKDLTLSTAVHRITFEETCGELGALLREARLVKELSPLYNRQLRRREKEVSLLLNAEGGHLVWLEGQEFEDSSANDRFGPFPSRVKARAVLAALAAEHQLCWKLLGLEKREGACFARQLRKCRGACCGEESVASHHLRLAQALLPYRLKPWPFRGAAGVREIHPDSGRECIEVFDHWRHLGSARDDTALHALLGAGPPPQFDFDVYRILERHLRSAANRRGVIDFAAIAPPY
jgi:DNA polymerase-3 subunit epsilon